MEEETTINKNYMMILFIILGVGLLMYSTAMVGYKVGAERVLEFKENYMNKYCFCIEPVENIFKPTLNLSIKK